MDYYHTSDFSEYEFMKSIVMKYYGEKLKYKNSEYILQHIDVRIIEKDNGSIVYSGFCVLNDPQGKTIQLSIKTVYDIVKDIQR